MVEVDDSIFGVDYSSNGGVSNTGDIELVEGLANAKQSIKNQILTKKRILPKHRHRIWFRNTSSIGRRF